MLAAPKLEVPESWEVDYDDDLDETLNEVLVKFHSCQSEDQKLRRIEALSYFEDTVNEWISSLWHRANVFSKGRMKTFGSFKLGVNLPDGDTDVLVVAPGHIHKADFFGSFVAMLENDKNVKNLNPMKEIFVPIIKMKYHGIDLDVIFARMNLETIPQYIDPKDDWLLMGMDEESIRALNGYRVAKVILELVENKMSFQIALRAIKLWAKKKGINSCVLGFFAGVTLAILVARTCQLNPEATPSKLVFKFFAMFSSWEWQFPIQLECVKEPTCSFFVSMENPPDVKNGMGIWTPTNPKTNTSHNVSKFTKAILVNELKEGLRVCEEIENQTCCWDKLFEEAPFFTKYSNYICVLLSANTKKEEFIYAGFLEAKICRLTKLLERNTFLSMAHINPKKFSPVATAQFEVELQYLHRIVWFFGLEYKSNAPEKLNFTKEYDEFKKILTKHGSRHQNLKVDVHLQQMNREELAKCISLKHLRQKTLFKKKAEIVAKSSSEYTNTASSTSSLSESSSKTNSLERTYANVVSNSKRTPATSNSTPPEPKTWAEIVSSSFLDTEKRNHH